MTVAILCMFCILTLQLYNLQIVQGESYTEIVESKKTQTKTVIGQRGSTPAYFKPDVNSGVAYFYDYR